MIGSYSLVHARVVGGVGGEGGALRGGGVVVGGGVVGLVARRGLGRARVHRVRPRVVRLRGGLPRHPAPHLRPRGHRRRRGPGRGAPVGARAGRQVVRPRPEVIRIVCRLGGAGLGAGGGARVAAVRGGGAPAVLHRAGAGLGGGGGGGGGGGPRSSGWAGRPAGAGAGA